MNNNTATRWQFWSAGVVGVVFAFLFSGLLHLMAPLLSGFAFLSVEQLGTNVGAILFLLALGFIVVAEWPIMLWIIIRFARQGSSAFLMNGSHAAYTFFPAVYGALGMLLTAEVWWLWVLVFLSLLRLSSSLLATPGGPRQMAERHAAQNKLVASKEDPISSSNISSEHSPLSTVPPRPRQTALHHIKGFVLDMDGVLYRGDRVRSGARDFITYLNQEKIPYVCLTNNSSRTSAMYETKLQRLRLPIKGSQVIGSAQAAVEWLSHHAAVGARILVVGSEGLCQMIQDNGFTLVEKAPADYVMVGIDFDLSYERLKRAALAIRQNAQFIGTNGDKTYPNEEGIVPGNGAALAYLEAATSVQPIVVGKPEPAMMNIALSHLGLPPEEVAIVGDRLETDILGGQRVGMITILLRGGVTSDAARAASPIKPDHVFHDLEELLDFYEQER